MIQNECKINPFITVDSLYAVYEASTLELWNYMLYTAIESHSVLLPVLFYVFLVVFIVLIVQVIIYSQDEYS